MIDVQDEVLENEPLYRGIDSATGEVVFEGITLEMITKILQSGTPINKALFDSIKADLESEYRNIPKGLICMWSGSVIPTGWLLCNGENGTPDLRDRFIVGSGNSYNIGDTGGSKEVTLTEEQIPAHKHSFNYYNSDVYTSGYALGVSPGTSADNFVKPYGTRVSSTQNLINNTGGGQAHENRPPYYALAFIMKA